MKINTTEVGKVMLPNQLWNTGCGHTECQVTDYFKGNDTWKLFVLGSATVPLNPNTVSKKLRNQLKPADTNEKSQDETKILLGNIECRYTELQVTSLLECNDSLNQFHMGSIGVPIKS